VFNPPVPIIMDITMKDLPPERHTTASLIVSKVVEGLGLPSHRLIIDKI